MRMLLFMLVKWGMVKVMSLLTALEFILESGLRQK